LADGRMQIFEINPRLGGTLMLPAQAVDLRAALTCIIEHATA
jgi:carbamoylphosphate synthase large subunit